VESGRVFVVLGAHVRVLTPIDGCQIVHYNLCMNISVVRFGKN
jgi:hypothetical protein